MKIDGPDYLFTLNDVEVETLRRAAVERGLSFDDKRITYTAAELDEYGLAREAYNSEELKALGVDRTKVMTSSDALTATAREHLQVDAPFANGIRKWQLPIDISEWRMYMTEFPPNSSVAPHVHPANTAENPGGSLRTVLTGNITYAGRTYGPGDWFYIPNGIPYTFRTAPDKNTTVLYSYAFFEAPRNRFSHPIDIKRQRVDQITAA